MDLCFDPQVDYNLCFRREDNDMLMIVVVMITMIMIILNDNDCDHGDDYDETSLFMDD